jgi:hypothetical protein
MRVASLPPRTDLLEERREAMAGVKECDMRATSTSEYATVRAASTVHE